MNKNTLPRELSDTLWLVKINNKPEVIATGAVSNTESSADNSLGFFLPGNEDFHDLSEIEEVLRPITINEESLIAQPDGFRPPAASLWLVVVECRYNVVKVSDDGIGFFIPGQEPCWLLPHVAEWLEQIFPQ